MERGEIRGYYEHLLTGKCLDDFLKWLSDYSEKWHYLKGWRENDQYLDEVELPPSLLTAVIEEFFDSVGVRIFISSLFLDLEDKMAGFTFFIYPDEDSLWSETVETEKEFKTRNEAKIAAIKEANRIYNGKV